jgi:AbrB family looped-hinge helix DNA binding protein
MSMVTVSPKYQVVIPREIREQMNIKPGQQVHMHKGVVVPLDGSLAIHAGEIGLALRLPLAGSIIYATARRHDAVLWTQDRDFRELPGVRYFG